LYAALKLALTAIITMDPEGGGTRYTSRVLDKHVEDVRKPEEMGFYNGWRTVIDKLDAFVAR
jgi:uncharacterized protein YndB with AHSA1/START domain